jgi:uncharacterized membrane protein
MKKYFLTGLVTLLPLAVTIWFIRFVVEFLTNPFIDVTIAIIDHHLPTNFIRIFAQLSILVSLFLFIFILGFVARRFFFKSLLRLSDWILYQIPLVNKVYKTSKDIVKSLFSSTKGSFKQVVMVQFPYPGCYCIGLIAHDAPKACSTNGDQKVSVFVPTTPNPTTGFLVMSHPADLIPLNMRSEDAIKYIVSCGVIAPESK